MFYRIDATRQFIITHCVINIKKDSDCFDLTQTNNSSSPNTSVNRVSPGELEEKLPETVFSGRYDEELDPNKNLLWCSTFQLCWDSLGRDVLGGDQELEADRAEAILSDLMKGVLCRCDRQIVNGLLGVDRRHRQKEQKAASTFHLMGFYSSFLIRETVQRTDRTKIHPAFFSNGGRGVAGLSEVADGDRLQAAVRFQDGHLSLLTEHVDLSV